MTKRKGFRDLIDAFSVARKLREMRLLILGDGYLRDELPGQVNRLGLGQWVVMPGNVVNPLKYFSRADVYALPSYSEGMPNVLVEAMMCGCTPVAYNCPTGPRELLNDGQIGYLVPLGDKDALARALIDAVDSPVSSSVLDEAVDAFREEEVLKRHFMALGIPGGGTARSMT